MFNTDAAILFKNIFSILSWLNLWMANPQTWMEAYTSFWLLSVFSSFSPSGTTRFSCQACLILTLSSPRDQPFIQRALVSCGIILDTNIWVSGVLSKRICNNWWKLPNLCQTVEFILWLDEIWLKCVSNT